MCWWSWWSCLLLEHRLVLTLIGILCLCLYLYSHHHFNYWTRLGIVQVYVKPLVGNLWPLISLSECSARVIEDIYTHPRAKDQPFVGIYLFHQPAVLLRDPELIKRILIRDFPKFCDRFADTDPEGDPLGSKNLFLLRNPAWKDIRFKLTPFFTKGKIKLMFPLIDEIGQNLNDHLLNLPLTDAASSTLQIEVKELSALYTTDVIATVAFGIQANSFINPNGDFRKNGRKIFHFNLRRALCFTLVFFLPHWTRFLKTKIIEDEQAEFLRSTINYVMAEREKSGQVRNDLIDILMEFKSSTKNANLKFEGDLLVAQAAIFFNAGFESSSATMAFALYEMARNPDVQDIVRQEIYKTLTKTQGKLTLESIESLEYMQMVIYETLRFYPPLPFLDRQCRVEKGQSYDMAPFHEFKMPQGMPVYVPVYAMHMDEKFFPDPHAFRPERFSPENRKLITPYTYMPFGLGPHACIGERFAYLQSKVGLLHILRNHRVSLASNTTHPLKFERKAVVLQAEGGIVLNMQRDPMGI